MFAPLKLFAEIACPEGDNCSFRPCLFHHSLVVKENKHVAPASISKKQTATQDSVPRTAKRLKSKHGTEKLQRMPSEKSPAGRCCEDQKVTAEAPILDDVIIPPRPPQQGRPEIKPARQEPPTLNPRVIQRPPAKHAVRAQLIKLLYQNFVRLDEQLRSSAFEKRDELAMSQSQLMQLAVDDEETAAKRNASIYQNVLKSRVAKLQKFKLSDWIAECLTRVQMQNPREPLPQAGIQSDLEDVSSLLPDVATLIKGSYPIEIPSTASIHKAQTGIDAAQNWEVCDRCDVRFQVFPGRRSDGKLATGGQCKHHPSRARRPHDQSNGQEAWTNMTHSCCGEDVGTSAGCSLASCHVFKVNDQARLSLLLPFEAVPSNSHPRNHGLPISIDCEMGYTTYGLELIRLTILKWPNGQVLEDLLVRPFGEVLDFNQQYSGVSPEQFSAANQDQSLIWNRSESDNLAPGAPMLMISSPKAARILLFSYMDKSTLLVGHALENDLNACRIAHRSIIDSALLFPHPRGLPYRLGLKDLVRKHLNREIQTSSVTGHDSKEDAQAAGDLVRFKLQQRKQMRTSKV